MTNIHSDTETGGSRTPVDRTHARDPDYAPEDANWFTKD